MHVLKYTRTKLQYKYKINKYLSTTVHNNTSTKLDDIKVQKKMLKKCKFTSTFFYKYTNTLVQQNTSILVYT